jgi:biuret amidohydrolase
MATAVERARRRAAGPRSGIMPLDLTELVAVGHTALVTQECQGATVGPDAALPQLAEIAQRVAVPNIARLAAGARTAGIPVIHCVAMRRDDGQGSNRNARLFLGILKTPVPLRPGTPAVEVVPEIGVAESDVVLSRLHGLGPMGGTDLDPVLRNLGVTTIVGVGVSVNIAITNFAMDAVNHGYQFVLPRDAVAGIPESYADDVIDNTLSLLATITTTDDVLAAWSGAPGS